MKTSKRLLALLMVVTLLLSSLSPAAAAAELPDASVSAAEDTVITLWTYPIGGWGSEDGISDLIAGFEAANPGITVNVEFLDYMTGDAAVSEAIENGTAPDLILEGPERLAANWGSKGLMADLSGLLDEADAEVMYAGALDACYGADGSLYAYPLAGLVHTMAINKTVFQAAGAMQYLDEESRTWNSTEDFFRAVQAVYDYTGQTVGTVYCGGQGGDQGTRALVNNLCGGTFTDAGHNRYTWDSAENIAALQALYDCEGISFDSGIVGGDEIACFYEGQLSMAFCWNISQQMNPNMANTGAGLTANGDEILYMAFPSDGTPRLCGGVWGFGAFDNGDAARLDAAKTFIRYMCDSDATVEAVEATGYFPVRYMEGVWSGNATMAGYAELMPMMGDYYQVTPNWGLARSCWWELLQDVGEGQDAASAAAYWNAQANGSEDVFITLWTFPFGDWGTEEGTNALIADFREAYPGIHVQVTHLDYMTGYDVLEEAIANGTAPDLIMEGPELLVTDFGARGLLADLSDLLDDADTAEIYPNALAAGHGADGSLYQYPLAGTVHTMAINKTVFEAAGAMQYLNEDTHTWNSSEDFFKAIQAVYDYTGQDVGSVSCQSIGGDQGPRGLVTSLYGGTFTNAEHTAYTWDSEQIIAALQTLKDCTGISFRTDLNGGAEIDAFINGTLNASFVWNPAQHLLYDGMTADGDEILMMAFPSDSEPQLQSGIWGFGVFDNGNAARIDAAKTFVKFMCDSAYTAEAVTATDFYPLRTGAEGTDLTGIWAEDPIRNDFHSMMPMMGDYYQVTTNRRSARTCWVCLLQDVAAGEDIASAAAYWNGEANGTNKTQISVLAPAYSDYTPGWWEQFELDYEAAYPDVDLVVECVSWNDIYSRLDEGYTPDILNIDGYQEYLDRLLPVQAYMSEETYGKFYPCFLAESELDGTVWAVPDLASARGLYYNTDMLEAVGMEAPTTWAELEAVCAAIKEYYGDEVIPFGLDLSENEGQLAFALAAWNNGGGFLDENGNWNLNSDANVEAVEFLARLYNSGYTNDIYQVRFDLMELFSQGQIAMTIAPSGWAPNCAFGITTIPANDGCASYSMGVMDRLMCFDNGYSDAQLAAITAFFDMFYDDARYAGWVFEEGFLPVTASGMEQLAADHNFLAPWADILPNCRFYPSGKGGWWTVRSGVIGVLNESVNGGDIRALLDDLQGQVTGGDEEHAPFLSFCWLDNWGEGWFQNEDWKSDAGWAYGYTHDQGFVPGDEFWQVYYLNTWNEETQSYDATPVHVNFSQQLSGTLLYDTEESVMPGAEDPEYYYRVRVQEDTWDQTAAISYTMEDGTELTLNVNICRGEAGFYNSSALRNDTYIREFYYDQINTDENVFYFGFQSDYWTLESVEPVLGHLGIPGHNASDVFTVEKVNDNVYKITLTPWAVSTGHGIEVGLNLYLTDPEGNSNNGEWYTCIWCHNGEYEEPEARIRFNHQDHHFFRTAAGDTVAYTEQFSGEYNDNGDETWVYGPTDLPAGVSYDLDTNTLTLNNASLEELALSFAADDWQNLPNADVTIVLIGENTISSDHFHAMTLNDNVNVTITGDGSLTLYSENSAQTDDNGNYFSYSTVNMYSNANLTIAGNAQVTVEIAGEALESCWDGDTYLGSRPALLAAIEGGNGSLTLKDNASLTTIVPDGSKMNGPKLENEEQVFWDDWYPGGCRGIFNMGTITIEGGTLNTQEIEIPSYWDENGFVGAGSFIQSGGTVNITARGSYGETEQWEWNEETQEDVYLGIVDHYHYTGLANYDGGYVDISGGELNVKCLQTEEEIASSTWSDGIRVGHEGEMIVSGGTVNVEVNRGNAVTVDNLTVSGGTLNATSHDGKGIETNTLRICGGTVNAEGRYDMATLAYELTVDGGTFNIRNEEGHGLYSNNISVSSGVLDIRSTNSGCIDVWNSFTVEGGTVNLNGKYGDVLNLCDADAKITGGTVTVTGEECLLIGVGGWEDPANYDGSMDGTLEITGGKLISNYTGDLGTALETRPYGHTTITGDAQVELNGHLVNYGTMDIAQNASVSVTNGGLHMEQDAVLNISGGTTNISMSRPEDRAADEFVEMGWWDGDINVTGGELVMEGTDLDRILWTCGDYYQSGGSVSFIANVTDAWKEAYREIHGTVPKPYAFETEGNVTIDGGSLYCSGHYGITLGYEGTNKLTVNDGDVRFLGEMNGMMLFGDAEFNGGSVHAASTGRFTEYYEENGELTSYYGGNAIMLGEGSSLTINGGDHMLSGPINEGYPKAGYGICSFGGEFFFNGGTMEAQADIIVAASGRTDPSSPFHLGENTRIHSLLDGHKLEVMDAEYYYPLYDEDGNIIWDEDGNIVYDESQPYYDFWLEEDGVYEDTEYNDYSTWVLFTTGTCGESTTWDFVDGELIICGPGPMDDYTTGDPAPWNDFRTHITSVTVEAGVIAIGSYAFSGCSNLKQIRFLGNAPTIGTNAFLGITATASYYADTKGWTSDVKRSYGGSITWDGIDVIASGWSGYTTWSLTDDGVLTFSGEGAMKNYTYKSEMPWYGYFDQITAVVIEEGVTSIGSYAFYGMPKLERIEIASTVTTIGDYAFKGSEKL
ncbi:MAG: extracellular solute-binding protein, partial [Oscillospiraceae bacterium]|nr:extracellular solute-binding protein [Oscillospiraceae bacterium]